MVPHTPGPLTNVVGLGSGLAKRRSASCYSRLLIVRAAARHLMRVHLAMADVASGTSAEQAVRKLQPPVFWKLAGEMKRQVEAWSPDAFARLVAVRVDSVRGGHKLLLFGNGDGAADARIEVKDFPAFVDDDVLLATVRAADLHVCVGPLGGVVWVSGLHEHQTSSRAVEDRVHLLGV